MREQFNKSVNDQLDRCKTVLIDKAKGYATDTDVFHNFNVAAVIQKCTPQQALGSMMCKHTVSIYDLIRDENVPLAVWQEKITDHINYLLILMAMVESEEHEKEICKWRYKGHCTNGKSDNICEAVTSDCCFGCKYREAD